MNINELDESIVKAIREQNYMALKDLNNYLFEILSENSFKLAEAIINNLIYDDNEDPYL